MTMVKLKCSTNDIYLFLNSLLSSTLYLVLLTVILICQIEINKYGLHCIYQDPSKSSTSSTGGNLINQNWQDTQHYRNNNNNQPQQQQQRQHQHQQQQQQQHNGASAAQQQTGQVNYSSFLLQEEQPPILDQCCACDEAKYEMVFEGLWSRYTHPRDFPQNYWLAHFSDIIGASHSTDFKMWDYDGYASEGVHELAEVGSTKRLESELKLESNKIRTIIKARELWYPNLNSKTFAVFRTDRQHHLVSILSKLGPSPDWMVGVSGLELCQRDCSWVPQRVINLYLWDAGTDSGTSYMSPDQPTIPQERIRPLRRLQSSTNNQNEQTSNKESSQPSVDSQSMQQDRDQMRPFARLTVTRQRIYEKSCNDQDSTATSAHRDHHTLTPSHQRGPSSNIGTTDSGQVPFFEQSNQDQQTPYLDCRVTNWTAWTPCNSHCGQGIRTRTRSFIYDKAHMIGCKKADLIEKEVCESECVGNVTCTTTAWSAWSDCSVTCGQGFRQRTRMFLDDVIKKSCSSIMLVDKEPCLGSLGEECTDDSEIIDPKCQVTKWSDWSPCSVACGRGVKIRVRRYLNDQTQNYCNVSLYQKAPCIGSDTDSSSNECPQPDLNHTKEICMKPKESGVCRAHFLRWYYDSAKGQCMKFVYGGCRGNKNNFERYQDCEKQCAIPMKANLVDSNESRQHSGKQSKQSSNNHQNSSSNQKKHQGGIGKNHQGGNGAKNNGNRYRTPIDPNLPIIDCVLSEWSPWSTCSALCGKGKKTRSRSIIQMPQNGGKPCEKKLVQRHRCKDLPPCPLLIAQNGNNQHNQQQHHLGTSSTTSPAMMDDDEDVKYARLKQQQHIDLNNMAYPMTSSEVNLPSDGLITELLEGKSSRIDNSEISSDRSNERRHQVDSLPLNDEIAHVASMNSEINRDPDTTTTTMTSDGCKFHDWTPWTDCDAPCDSGRGGFQIRKQYPTRESGEHCKIRVERYFFPQLGQIDCLSSGAKGPLPKCLSINRCSC